MSGGTTIVDRLNSMAMAMMIMIYGACKGVANDKRR